MSGRLKKEVLNHLKTPCNRSHNEGSQLIALIKFLARRAAEDDFKVSQERSNSQHIEGKEQ